jgi:hypothetical protein
MTANKRTELALKLYDAETRLKEALDAQHVSHDEWQRRLTVYLDLCKQYLKAKDGDWRTHETSRAITERVAGGVDA